MTQVHDPRLPGLATTVMCVTVLVTTAVLPHREARACTPVLPGLNQRTTYPADGAVGIPTNTEVLLHYKWLGPLGTITDVKLQSAAGTPVAATVSSVPAGVMGGPPYWWYHTLVVIRPTTPLAAGTKYQVLDRIPTVPCAPTTCQVTAYTPVASFTTGAATDNTPPSFTGPSALPVVPHSCGIGSCCGPIGQSVFTLPLTWTKATDSSGLVIRYRIYEGKPGGTLLVSLLDRGWTSGLVDCGGYLKSPFGVDFPGGKGPFFARAVDLAGNEDANTVALTFTYSCPVVDAGPPDSVPPDAIVPDFPSPDLPAPDASLPDVASPDLPATDLPAPDASLPDMAAPDLPLPDLPLADASLQDAGLPDAPMSGEVDHFDITDPWFDAETPTPPVAERGCTCGLDSTDIPAPWALLVFAILICMRRRLPHHRRSTTRSSTESGGSPKPRRKTP